MTVDVSEARVGQVYDNDHRWGNRVRVTKTGVNDNGDATMTCELFANKGGPVKKPYTTILNMPSIADDWHLVQSI